MKRFKVFEGTTNQIDTRDRLKSIYAYKQINVRRLFIKEKLKNLKKKRRERERNEKKTNIQPYKNGQTDGRTDRQSYLCSWWRGYGICDDSP